METSEGHRQLTDAEKEKAVKTFRASWEINNWNSEESTKRIKEIKEKLGHIEQEIKTTIEPKTLRMLVMEKARITKKLNELLSKKAHAEEMKKLAEDTLGRVKITPQDQEI